MAKVFTPEEIKAIALKHGFDTATVKLDKPHPEYYGQGSYDLNPQQRYHSEKPNTRDFIAVADQIVHIDSRGGDDRLSLNNIEAKKGDIQTGSGNDEVILRGNFYGGDDGAPIDLGDGNDTVYVTKDSYINLPSKFVSTGVNQGDNSGYTAGSSFIDGGKGINTIVLPPDVKLSDVQLGIWYETAVAGIDEPKLVTPNGELKLRNFQRVNIQGVTYDLKVTKGKGDEDGDGNIPITSQLVPHQAPKPKNTPQK